MRHVTMSLLLIILAHRDSSGQTPGGLTERLGPVAKAQAAAHERFLKELEGKTTDEAQRPAVDRFEAEVARNTGKILEMVRASPTDPGVVESLKFVIKTARVGPGDESYRAMEILLRDHVRDPGMGDLCGRIFHFTLAPVAESLLRAVLERHPNRNDRGIACRSLANYWSFANRRSTAIK